MATPTGSSTPCACALLFLLAATTACTRKPEPAPEPQAQNAPIPHAYLGAEKCLECHLEQAKAWAGSHDASTYDATTHHHHDRTKAGGSCVGCHMGAVTYMGVDVRHDHSFRIPDPQFRVEGDAPNTCSACHPKEGDRRAAKKVEEWYGSGAGTTFGRAFLAAEARAVDAEVELLRIIDDPTQPPIVRASALGRLGDSVAVRLIRAAMTPEPR